MTYSIPLSQTFHNIYSQKQSEGEKQILSNLMPKISKHFLWKENIKTHKIAPGNLQHKFK
jgi:hypothetical protein